MLKLMHSSHCARHLFMLLVFFVIPSSALGQANFAVNIDGTNSPITEGATLEVSATIENTGDQSDFQDVTLVVGGVLRDTRSLTLSSGESQSVTLTWNTAVGDSGDYNASVASEDDQAVAPVSVLSQANFTVSLQGTNSPVTERDVLEVMAAIENAGDQSGTQNVTLEVGGVSRDTDTLTLSGGQSQSITLTWNTAIGDSGDYNAIVASEDDSAGTSVSVLALPDEIFQDRFESQ